MADSDQTHPPLKPSGHQVRQRASAGGHDIDLDTAKKVVADPTKSEIQDDGRLRLWGRIDGLPYPIRVVVSAGVSAGVAIRRLVTAHIDSSKRGR